MNLKNASQWAEVIGLITILGAAIYSSLNDWLEAISNLRGSGGGSDEDITDLLRKF